MMLQCIDIGSDEFSFARIANPRAVNFPGYPRCAERVARAFVRARAKWEVRHTATVRTDIRLCKLDSAAMCSFAVTAAPTCTRVRNSCMKLPMQLSGEAGAAGGFPHSQVRLVKLPCPFFALRREREASPPLRRSAIRLWTLSRGGLRYRFSGSLTSLTSMPSHLP
jgi:hypothetical protein